MVAVAATSGYLLSIEVYQLAKNGVSYFLSVWNYLDIVPPVMICLYMFFDLIDFFTPEMKET